jgi:hypothetical protein
MTTSQVFVTQLVLSESLCQILSRHSFRVIMSKAFMIQMLYASSYIKGKKAGVFLGIVVKPLALCF